MEEKLVKLTFKEDGQEFYFGSYSAIYTLFDRDKIGVSLESLWNVIKKKNGRYENSIVSIITTKMLRSGSKSGVGRKSTE